MRRIARWCAVVLLALTPSAAAVAQRYLVPGEGPLNSPPTALAPTLWFVELESLPLAEATTTDPERYLDRLRKEKQDFRNAARAARIQFSERFTFDTLWNGVSVRIAPRHLLALSRLPGVAALYPAGAIEAPPPATPISGVAPSPELFTALGMTGATIAQAAGHTGAGVRVAVMDTGIDYLHPDLGGGFGPGFKVAGGHDFVGDAYNGTNDPVPDPDPLDCGGHGTHVAGILAGNGLVKGVAPEAELRAYKVFGCTGTTEDDIMLAAMERVLADGNQVLNMSIGAAFQWPQAPTARAAKNLVNRGVVVVTSAGNAGADGLYSGSAPGVGQKVIASAAVDNVGLLSPAFRLGDGPLIGYQPMTGAPAPPTSGGAAITNAGRGCNADLPLPAGVAGNVALIERGVCAFREKAINARNAGAVAVLIYNNVPGIALGTVGTPALTFPVASLSREDGLVVRAALPANLTWTTLFASPALATGGLVSTFSAFGLAPDLSLKPDIAAPGGLIFSTIPRALGAYGLNSGTSMASPHVAGAVALLLQAHPNTPSQAVRDILQNSASPRLWFGNPGLGLIESAHKQGAGLLDIPAAIAATTRVTPGKLELGEGEAGPVTRTLTIENKSDTDVTYDFVARPAVATGAPTFVPQFFQAAAGVGFSVPELLVPARATATVDVTFTEPASLAQRGIFGGLLSITPRGGGRGVVVPFAGVKGDYQSVLVLNPAASSNGNPLLRQDATLGPSIPVVVDEDDDKFAHLFVHLDHAVRRLRLEVITAGGTEVGRLADLDYVGRNRTPGEFFLLVWDGTGPKGAPLQDGSYRLVLSVQKALGDDANPAHWESWTSPVVTLQN